MLTGWHCDVFASCTIQHLQGFVCLAGFLGASWDGNKACGQLGNILLEWPREAEAGEMEMGIPAPCWQINLFIFHTTH